MLILSKIEYPKSCISASYSFKKKSQFYDFPNHRGFTEKVKIKFCEIESNQRGVTYEAHKFIAHFLSTLLQNQLFKETIQIFNN